MARMGRCHPSAKNYPLMRAENPVARHANVVRPNLVGLVVFAENRHVELVAGNGEFLGDKLPRPGNGLLLEVVAERKVAEHLEEGVVAGGAADLFEVVVLAARAHALLGGGGTRIIAALAAQEHVLAIAKANAEKNLQNARAIFESHLQSVFSQRGAGWVETTLGETYDVRDGTHDSPKYHATGYPLITSKNLKREGLSFDDVMLISEQDYNKINERSVVHKGDVLFAMIGTIGNPTLVMVEPKFAIKNVALFKIPSGQNGAFLKHYLDSALVISKMMKDAKGSTQKFVGLGYLRGFPINVPPLATQLKVVERLDALSEETQRLEALYQSKLSALDELKKSLLHSAFNGKL